MRRLPRTLVLAAVCLVAAGCGIPVSASPTRVKAPLPDSVTHPLPRNNCLVQVTPPTATISIYLVKGIQGSLVPVTRCVARPLTPQKVLTALIEGPIAPELRDNLESVINVDSRLQVLGPVRLCPQMGIHVSCGVVTVRLDHYFAQLQGEEPIQELGQIVWSLTESGLGITEVRFVDPDGKPIAVETASGTFVRRPVSIADYLNLGA